MSKGYKLSKGAVQIFLDELKGMLNEKQVILNIIEREDKEEGYNLSDCRAELGIDNNDIKEYLKSLSIENYVETCDDERNKKSNSYYIFGKFIKEKEMEDVFKGVELEDLSIEGFFDKLLNYHFK